MDWKKVSLEGFILGVLLSLLSTWLLGVPADTLLGAYALLVFLFSAYLTSSLSEGGLLGLFAVIGEVVTDFIYSVFVARVLVSLVPYAVGLTLFIGRIGVFPLMGAMGGYLGQQYFAEKKKPRLRAKRGQMGKEKGRKEKRAARGGELTPGSESSH